MKKNYDDIINMPHHVSKKHPQMSKEMRAAQFGAFAATLGIVFPSFVIITIISILLNIYSYLTPIKYAFFGIRAGVLALVVNAFVSMFRKCSKDVKSYIIMALAFLVVTFTGVNVIFIIIGCGLLGLFSYEIAKRRTQK